MLRDKPLAHHDKLLRLTEQGNQKERDRLWPDFELLEVNDWKVLTDDKYDGTLEQRSSFKELFQLRLCNPPRAPRFGKNHGNHRIDYSIRIAK